MIAWVEMAGRRTWDAVEELGANARFLGLAMRSLVREGIRWDRTRDQMVTIGVQSIFVILLTGLFTGLVFALQTSYAFGLFGAEGLIGPSVVLSLTRELSPVLTALMLTGRAGSAMATELGTMRVTEQIDALETMAVSPMRFLVVPRLVAATVMTPLLVMFFNAVGVFGGYVVSVHIIGVSRTMFWDRILGSVDLLDLWSGLYKGAVFGFLIALICTSRGYRAKGGARGVGEATTGAVVVSNIVTLVADYIITAFFFG